MEQTDPDSTGKFVSFGSPKKHGGRNMATRAEMGTTIATVMDIMDAGVDRMTDLLGLAEAEVWRWDGVQK